MNRRQGSWAVRNMCRCLLAALLLAATTAAVAQELRMSWGPHNAPPYAMASGERLTGGIIQDLGLELARRTGTEAAFPMVPRARYEPLLREGRVHVTCITNPQWLASPGDYLWSPPLFEETDVIVLANGAQPVRAIADLRGRRVGTLKSYRYPALEPLFADHSVLRDDAASLDSNLQRLLLGRVDAVVDADIPVRHWLARHGDSGRLRFAEARVSQHAVHCAISRAAPAGAEALRDALGAMVGDGTVTRILQRYGN